MEELLKELVEKTGNLQQMVMLLIIFLNLIKLIKNALGIYVTTLDGQEFFCRRIIIQKFTIQSIFQNNSL